LAEGAVRGQLSHACDWAPTLLQLCDIKSNVENFDGQSLVEVIQNEEATSPHDAVHWDLGSQWAVRQGAWKLIHNVRATAGPNLAEEDQKWFLSNLKEDRGEMKNYVSHEPQVVKRLRQKHKAMRAEEK
ncbi:MAG: sulfatase/phosphatase domain-containing protein, partial [Pirellulales bacterium]